MRISDWSSDVCSSDLGQRARERGAETDQMGTAVLLRDVVGEAEHRFLVGVGPLDRDVDGDARLLAADRDHVRVQRGLELRQVLYERGDDAPLLESAEAPFPPLVVQVII